MTYKQLIAIKLRRTYRGGGGDKTNPEAATNNKSKGNLFENETL